MILECGAPGGAVEAAVGDGFAHVDGQDGSVYGSLQGGRGGGGGVGGGGEVEVGDGAGDAEDAVVGAG